MCNCVLIYTILYDIHIEYSNITRGHGKPTPLKDNNKHW